MEKMDNVKTPEELMEYMNNNIEYGWIDYQGEKHVNTLVDLREKYRISSLDEIFETGLGTCIEQAKFIKAFFDQKGYETKLYCFRSYETTDNFDQNVRMHCFVIYYSDGNWYHFEHSNTEKRGIHKYESIEEALEKITSGYQERGDIRVLSEIDYIPDGLSFKEFNEFVNQYDDIKKKH